MTEFQAELVRHVRKILDQVLARDKTIEHAFTGIP